MRTSPVHVTCYTCEDSYELSSSEINLICCEDTQSWTFSFLCKECGQIGLFDLSDKNLKKLLRCRTNLIFWKKPEIHLSNEPPLNNQDLSSFQVLLDSTNDIVSLVEAV